MAEVRTTHPKGFRIRPVGTSMQCEVTGLEHLQIVRPNGTAILVNDYPIDKKAGESLLAAVLSDGLAPLKNLPDNAICVALRLLPGGIVELIAARDPIANTPLHVDCRPTLPVIASHTSLLDRSRQELETEALQEYLLFRYTAGPRTLIRGILQPLASHAIVTRSGEPAQHVPYADLRTMFRSGRYEDVVAALPEILRASIAREDPFSPLGVMYSGGLDSAFVAFSMPGRQCELLSMGFPAEGAADIKAAQSIPLPRGHRLTTIEVDATEFASHLPRAIDHFGWPIDHPNFVARDMLFEWSAARGIYRLLSGEGSDTIFGGSWYVALCKALLLKRFVPSWVRRLPLPTTRGEQIRRLLGTPVDDLVLFDKTYYSQQRARLLGDGLIDGTSHLRAILGMVRDWDPLDQAFYVAHLTTLSVYPSAHRAMAWASGVDVGYPFLDGKVVRAAASVPGRDRVRGMKAKRLFVPVAAKVVPDQVRLRPKYGLAVPLRQFTRDPSGLRRYADLVIAEDGVACNALDREQVRNIVRRAIHDADSRDDLELYWVLLNLEIWGRTRLRGETVA